MHSVFNLVEIWYFCAHLSFWWNCEFYLLFLTNNKLLVHQNITSLSGWNNNWMKGWCIRLDCFVLCCFLCMWVANKIWTNACWQTVSERNMRWSAWGAKSKIKTLNGVQGKMGSLRLLFQTKEFKDWQAIILYM